ncbi:MAG TPA: alpha/beta hydrolase [Syntrophales bacterium]|nr:alpha/beta hydrolase [Syntrophales bacterium]
MPVKKDGDGKPVLMTQNVGDADLPYLLYNSHGPTLLLLHATGFLPWLWHPIARELSPAYRIIAPCICDYRKADPDKGGLHWMTIAKDISVLCSKNGIENPLLVGHSMGATVSMIAHTLYGVKARALILIEPIFLREDFYRIHINVKDHPLASKAVKRKNHWKNQSEAMSYLRSKSLFKNWTEEMLELYIAHGMKERKGGGLELVCSPKTEAALFIGGVQYNIWPLISKISCPVLVIEGENTDSKNYIDLERTVAMLPNSSHIIVANAGHLIPMEQPSKIAAIIGDFFKSIPL